VSQEYQLRPRASAAWAAARDMSGDLVPGEFAVCRVRQRSHTPIIRSDRVQKLGKTRHGTEKRKEEVMSEAEIEVLRRNLSLLIPSSVENFYRETHKACEVERKPGPRAIQQLVQAWKQLRKWRRFCFFHLL